MINIAQGVFRSLIGRGPPLFGTPNVAMCHIKQNLLINIEIHTSHKLGQEMGYPVNIRVNLTSLGYR